MSVSTVIILAGMAVLLVFVLLSRRRRGSSVADTFKSFLDRDAVTFITVGLVANTVVAQLYVRTFGQLQFGGMVGTLLLYVSAVGITLAFALFETMQVRNLNEMATDGLTHTGADWVRNIFASLFASSYNLYCVAMLEYELDPTNHHKTSLPSIGAIPFTGWLTASAFTLLLFFVSFVGHTKESDEQRVKAFQGDTQATLLSEVKRELPDVLSGKKPPSPSFIALCAMGSEPARVFFTNFINAMTGAITLDDVNAGTTMKGLIKPGASRQAGIVAVNGVRTPEQWDELRIRMVQDGFPLPDLTPDENDTCWLSLIGGERRKELLKRVGMKEPELAKRIADLAKSYVNQNNGAVAP